MKKLNKFLKSIIWLLPFSSFSIGYYLTNLFLVTKEIEVPYLIGKTLNEASKILSDHNLNLRILSEKEDFDLPDGTIIDQNPVKQKIKSNKSVYLCVSRKFTELKMPDLKNKKIAETEAILQKIGIKYRIYYLESIITEDTCIAQYPEPGKLIDKKNEKTTLYISSGNKKPVLIPNFKGLDLKEALNFLSLYEIKPTIYTSNLQKYDADKNYIIIDQKPISGSILQLNKNLNIQLQAQEITNN